MGASERPPFNTSALWKHNGSMETATHAEVHLVTEMVKHPHDAFGLGFYYCCLLSLHFLCCMCKTKWN